MVDDLTEIEDWRDMEIFWSTGGKGVAIVYTPRNEHWAHKTEMGFENE
jgi:hypothetical protein